MNFQRLLCCVQRSSYLVRNIATSSKCVSHNAQFNPQRFLEVEDGWRQKDGMPKDWRLIYKAPMANILNYTSAYLTISSGFLTCAAAYYGIFVYNEDLDKPVMIGDDVLLADSPTEALIYLGAFYLFHIAMRVVLSKFVVRLYQNGDNYIAIFRGYMFNSIKKHEFHLEEFKKLNPTLVVSWGDARYGLGEKHGILLENYFKTPESLNRLLYKRKIDEADSEDSK